MTMLAPLRRKHGRTQHDSLIQLVRQILNFVLAISQRELHLLAVAALRGRIGTEKENE
jgi:hypothetical protein